LYECQSGLFVYVNVNMCNCFVQDLVASNDIRSAIGELRQILSTPIREYDSAVEASSEHGDDETGQRSSELGDCLNDADLPGLITRVLGKCELMSAHLSIFTYLKIQIESNSYFAIRFEMDATIQNFRILKPRPERRFWRL